jgi:hypothetical protein
MARLMKREDQRKEETCGLSSDPSTEQDFFSVLWLNYEQHKESIAGIEE